MASYLFRISLGDLGDLPFVVIVAMHFPFCEKL